MKRTLTPTQATLEAHLLACGWTRDEPSYGPLSIPGELAYSKPGHDLPGGAFSSQGYARWHSLSGALEAQIAQEHLAQNGWKWDGSSWSHTESTRKPHNMREALAVEMGLVRSRRQKQNKAQ